MFCEGICGRRWRTEKAACGLEDGKQNPCSSRKGGVFVRTVTAKSFSTHLHCISEALLGKLDVETKKNGFSFSLSEFYTSVRHRRFRSL